MTYRYRSVLCWMAATRLNSFFGSRISLCLACIPLKFTFLYVWRLASARQRAICFNDLNINDFSHNSESWEDKIPTFVMFSDQMLPDVYTFQSVYTLAQLLVLSLLKERMKWWSTSSNKLSTQWICWLDGHKGTVIEKNKLKVKRDGPTWNIPQQTPYTNHIPQQQTL